MSYTPSVEKFFCLYELNKEKENAREIIEAVYALIKNNSGKIRLADLDNLIGNGVDVRYGIAKLVSAGMVKRVRGFGSKGIEYYYHDMQQIQK